MARQSFVELDSGEQEYFSNPYEAFKYAKTQELQCKNSVEFVAVSIDYGETEDDWEVLMMMDQVTVYRGQRLRHLIRSLDDVTMWLRTQIEEQLYAEEHSEDS